MSISSVAMILTEKLLDNLGHALLERLAVGGEGRVAVHLQYGYAEVVVNEEVASDQIDVAGARVQTMPSRVEAVTHHLLASSLPK